jgi:hypothetical protein
VIFVRRSLRGEKFIRFLFGALRVKKKVSDFFFGALRKIQYMIHIAHFELLILQKIAPKIENNSKCANRLSAINS